MKLLIITSEYLYEGYTLGATFELSQAHILSEKFDVSILSVSPADSLSASIKALVRRILAGNGFQKNTGTITRLKKTVSSVLLEKKIVTKYKIEGLSTYEGANYAVASYGNFEKQLRCWIKAGMNAFDAYCSDNGKPDIIHAHGRFLNAGALALEIKKRYGIQYIYTDHSTFYQQGIAPPEAKPFLKEVINESAAYVTVSESLENYIAQFLQQPVKKALIIPNVIDPVFERPLQVNTEKGKSFTFINVAALEYKKGHDVLIRAFAAAFKNNPYYQLIIVGDGPLKADLESLAVQSGIDNNVRFAGYLSKKEVLGLLDKSDAMVFPSRVETFGVVIIEALARGLPVISTISGGPEYIIRKDSGILIEPGKIDALTKALISVAENYSCFNREEIRASTLKKYGTRTFLSSMEDVYNLKAV